MHVSRLGRPSLVRAFRCADGQPGLQNIERSLVYSQIYQLAQRFRQPSHEAKATVEHVPVTEKGNKFDVEVLMF